MAMRQEGFDRQQMPLSDVSFDIITALQNKLEALAIYETYMDDCDEAGEDETRRLFEQIMQDDHRHAQLIRSHLEALVREGRFH